MTRILKFAFLVILFAPFLSIAQDMGTIELNQDFAATVEFDENIDYILIGNNPIVKVIGDQQIHKYYEIFQKNNVAIFRAVIKEAIKTTLTITLESGAVYHGYISYAETPIKNFYKFKKIITKSPKEIEDSIRASIEKETIDRNMKKILYEKQKIEDVAVVKRSEIYQVSNIANDDKFTYIKILIFNKSASNYVIDAVMFNHEEGKKRKLDKKEVVNENWMQTKGFIFPEGNEVKANTTGIVVFAIPLYTTQDGFLNIKIMEKSGSRTTDIQIPAKKLAGVEVYK